MSEQKTRQEIGNTGGGAAEEREIDALVVGAGPVGLAMACELLRHGVRCRIIEQAEAPAQTSRALGVHARTLEVFENMGVIEKVLEAGTKAKGLSLHEGDRVVLRLSMQHIRERDSQYPFLLVLPQQETERILTERLNELGGTVERSRELLDIRQEEGAVIAVVKAGGENAQIRARWLIGCDGAKSRVRKVMKISFVGTTAPEEWLLGDVDLDWNRTRETTHGWFTRDGVLAAFPLPSGQWRLIAPAITSGSQEVPQAAAAEFQRLLVQFTGDTTTTVSNPTWLSNFRINYRMVTTYRKGRIFLAGDAAHIHSPFGGQGMNIGIQDAFNLGWKLALVVQGRARESLLDTYQEERMPIARFVLKGAQATTGGIIVTHNPLMRWLRDHAIIPLLNLDSIQRRLAQETSELNMHYRRSSLSRSYAKSGVNIAGRRAPHAGDRVLPGECLSYPDRKQTTLSRVFQGTESHLLLFAGDAPADSEYKRLAELASHVQEATGGCVRAHLVISGNEKPVALAWDGSLLLDPQGKLHTLYGARRQSLYFIRPDGYIGLRCQPARAERLYGYPGAMFLGEQHFL